MKLQIAILAVMLFLAVSVFLYINPVERVKPLLQKSVEESVAPNDNSNLDDIPAPQKENRPDRRKPEPVHTIVVILQNQTSESAV